MENELNTIEAKDFAVNAENSVEEIKNAWWEMFSNYRVKRWRQELKKQSERTGMSFSRVCEYIGTEVSETPGFYKKLPKSRETYIAIGMAYRQPAEVINKWITRYGSKRALYVKDILEDMIWLYLINANYRDNVSDKNYYREFENAGSRIAMLYNEIWEQDINESMGTADLENDFRYIEYDDEYFALKRFVSENMDSFKTAYAKPRKMLDEYISNILRTKNENVIAGRKWTLNTLRGYLDDSMINYLSGYSDSINSYDKSKGCRTPSFKHVPKNKKAHISLCLAMGMTVDEIDKYLELMGYAPLDGIDRHEGPLINIIRSWDDTHPLQRKYKEKYISGNKDIELDCRDELLAVNEMLQMRNDIKEIYESDRSNDESKKEKFPYMND